MASGQPSICIVGAGAAGLSAAWYLKKAGYTNVAVLESAGRVGGKCWSVPIGPGNRVLELGAVEITPAYADVLELAREMGAEMQVAPFWGTANPDTHEIVLDLERVIGPYSWAEVAVAAVRYYASVRFVYRDYVSAPGMAGPIGVDGVPAGIPTDLCVPMSEWLATSGLEALSGLFAYVATIYGYGDVAETPAAYVLRLIEWRNFRLVVLNVLKGLVGIPTVWPKIFTLGYQDLWTRVAQQLGNVRLNTVIRGITRGESITVMFGDGSAEVFDKLIVTCCLDATLPSLISDLTPAERDLFAATLYTDYTATAVSMQSFPKGLRTRSYSEVPHPPAGHPCVSVKAWDDVDAAVYYSVGVPSGFEPSAGNAIYKLIVKDAATLGYQVGPIIESGGVKLQKQWRYFPHVRSDVLNNHYLALEELQGQKNTFYSGGLLSFETVHNVVTYSRSLVGRSFPPCPGSR